MLDTKVAAVAADYPDKIREIGDHIANLEPAEARELNDYLEVTYNIVPLKVLEIVLPPEPEEVDQGPATFDVILTSFGDKKVPVIKAIRKITGLALMAAKKFVESAPKAVQEGVSKEDAEALKIQLEEAGATVTLK